MLSAIRIEPLEGLWLELSSTSAKTAEQSATSRSSSGTRSDSNSQDGFETSVTSSGPGNTSLVRTVGKGLGQSIYATHPSQSGNASQPKETCRARRLRTYQQSHRTGDGHMAANGKWKPNSPNVSGGAGRGPGKGGFLGNTFQRQDSLPFHHQNHFPPHRLVHQQLAFPLQEPFPQSASDQFDRV